MNIILKRLTTSDEGTFGVLIRDNKPFMVTLELPWKDNKRKISCIPPGTYHSTKMFSEKFQKEVYVLHDVPDRDLIELHVGNTIADTVGCILLGLQFSIYEQAIVSSVLAFNSFMSLIPVEGFILTIQGEV